MPKKIDLTGQTFGHLTVLGPAEGTSRYLTWRCRCDCGRTIDVDSRQLRRGTILSCGHCGAEMRPKKGRTAEDLTGQTFGRLTVLGRAENRQGRIYWKCQCSCGNITEASSHNLKLGLKKSCGCLRKEGHHRRELTGERFGRLVALKPTEQKDSHGSILWLCQCDCGNQTLVSATDLVQGNNRSCGCLRKESQQMVHDRLHLEDGTCIEWLDRRRSRKDNASGYRGVFRRKNGKYSVTIGFKKQRYYLGNYATYEEAVEARKRGEERIHRDFLRARALWQERAEEDAAWAEENPFRFEVIKVDGGLVIENSMASYMEEKPEQRYIIAVNTAEEMPEGTGEYAEYKKYIGKDSRQRYDGEGTPETEAVGAAGNYAGAEP